MGTVKGNAIFVELRVTGLKFELRNAVLKISCTFADWLENNRLNSY